MSSTSNLNAFSSAAEMADALRRRHCSARELLEAHIRRIERFDPALNSIVIQDIERAHRDAAAADDRLSRGDASPWLGVPITIKESIDVQGLASTAGVPHRRGHVAERDALTVARLRSAGAVILGKTNVCTWLADFNADNPVYGRTNNPFDLTRTPGGSSGGSASLAAGLTAMDLGSDLGGSLRVPAAFCGLYGHRPSETTVPNSGHFPGSSLPNAAAVMAIQGPQTRTAGDLALAFDTIAGPDVGMEIGWKCRLPAARFERLKDFRVAVIAPQPWLAVDGEIQAALDRVAAHLVQLGAQVRPLHPPPIDLAESYALFRSMMAVMVSSRWPAERRAQVAFQKRAGGDRFQLAESHGFQATSGDYLLFHERREAIRAAWRGLFRDYDVLLTPATITVAFEHTTVPPGDRRLTIDGREMEFDYMSFYPGLSNLPGHPATAFPAGFNAAGLPIGLQAIGPFLEDRTAIRFAQLLENELGGFTPPKNYVQELL
ncbi:MAG TPA: amidase [Tepidisphaeraceae bacterium]|jgi:amidase|nr:amidase [Tepidisphaeraceae bacterium]